MTSTTDATMASDGLKLVTRHWDCDEPRARVLLIHGIAEHSGRFEHVGEFLAERGYEVRSFDLRGHGGSDGMRCDIEFFEQYVDDVESVFSELPQDLPTVIYGHSLGGLIATSYAVSGRPQPSFYVLSAPALAADVPTPLKVAAKVMAKVRPKTRLPNSIKGEQLSRDPSVGERYFEDPLLTPSGTARFGAALLAQIETINGELDRFNTPALVIHGAQDELVPPHASAPLAALPGVERRLFPGLRHEIHNEPEQDEVLGFVVAWLDDQLA